jgi:4-methyl-5(b-hydroxyethyl)-thiazole monophosphate biosynthesis
MELTKNALILLSNGVEEIEAVSPIDLLRRAEVDVTICSCDETLWVNGRSGISIQADCNLQSIAERSFDLLVLPGGPGVFELRKNPFVLKVIQKHFNHGKWIGAICAAPLLLLDAKVLNGTKYTAHASVVNELPNLLPEEDVVVDKNIITSAGAGTAVRFGLKLVELLLSEEKANEIAHSIHAPYPIEKK